MLDRAADPEREVELRLDDLAGLADLLGVRDPARIDRRTRRADRAAERRGELADEREPVRAADAAAARDDDPSRPRSDAAAASATIRSTTAAGGPSGAAGAAVASTTPGDAAASAVTAFGRTVTMPRPAVREALRVVSLPPKTLMLRHRPPSVHATAVALARTPRPVSAESDAGEVAAVRAGAGEHGPAARAGPSDAAGPARHDGPSGVSAVAGSTTATTRGT